MNKYETASYWYLFLVMAISCLNVTQLQAQAKDSSLTIPVTELDPALVREDTYEGMPWRLFTLPKKDRTVYERITVEADTYIRSHSKNSASGLLYETQINPLDYPLMEWSWKTESVLEKGNMAKKDGDDYAVRIYVTFEYNRKDLPLGERIKYGALKTFTNFEIPLRSLNYVWANSQPSGTMQKNVFTNWVTMIAVQSGNEKAGQWILNCVNVYEDYKKAFNEEPRAIKSITIMTDSDNTGSEATGYFKDIRFVKKK